jgi:hypothetical protein
MTESDDRSPGYVQESRKMDEMMEELLKDFDDAKIEEVRLLMLDLPSLASWEMFKVRMRKKFERP